MDQIGDKHPEAVRPLRRPQLNEFALLPPEAPIDMPVQSLGLGQSIAVRDSMTWQRALLLLLTAAATGTFGYLLYQVLSVVQITVLQAVFLVLCTMCFAWIALGTSSAVLGFFAALAGPREQGSRSATDGEHRQRTALLFPVYQEDAARVAATIEAIVHELVALQAEQRFDIFVLSDSRSGDAKARELRAARLLRRRLQERVQIHYRARAANTGKKAGNIADWVQRFGAAYDSFVILDADSIMSGALLVRLQAIMAGDPKAGLIQTVPRLVGAGTLFARLQQFAVACYGPIIATGFAVWHQQSGNYWGHNAIVRTHAFAQAAGLPDLSGSPPFGGYIQSHDFVEAAFLRRAGWEVRMLPDLQGSYEGCPPTLIDVAVRDRRWAQGNLQHLRIVGARGLPWVSRMHLAMGAYAYFASALWALSLIVGIVLSVQSAYTLPVYFPDSKTLFPIWPVIDPTKALYLFIATIVVLLLPKVLGIVLTIVRRHPDAPRPKLGALLAGAFIEMFLSVLIAPILMLTQTSAVVEILRGKDSGWSVQRRAGDAPKVEDVVGFHSWHLVVGGALAVICALTSAYVFAWMSPIFLGLLLSAGISLLTARPAATWVARALATSESIAPPPIVAAVDAAHPVWTALLQKNRDRLDGSASPERSGRQGGADHQ
jgi:membrane glycosyltransferase